MCARIERLTCTKSLRRGPQASVHKAIIFVLSTYLLQGPCIVSKAAPKMRASQVPCCSTYLTTQEVPGESGEGLCFQSCYYDNTNIPTGWGLVHRWIHTVHLEHVSAVQQPGFSGCDAALGYQSCPKSHIFQLFQDFASACHVLRHQPSPRICAMAMTSKCKGN